MPFPKLRIDPPSVLADYLLSRPTTCGKHISKAVACAKTYLLSRVAALRQLRTLGQYVPYKLGSFTVNKRFLRRITKGSAKRKARRHAGPYTKFGVSLPRNLKEAMLFDRINGNTLWLDAVRLELGAILDFDTYVVQHGKNREAIIRKHWAKDYKTAPLHLIYDVKIGCTRKAMYVAGGHLFSDPEGIHGTYSSNVKVALLRYLFYIAAINGLEIISEDVKNAYLNSKCSAKLYTILGQEYEAASFPGLSNQVAIIDKAQYYIPVSGADWHRHFVKKLAGLGFVPSRADCDIWMQKVTQLNLWEYVNNYTDDVIIFSRKAQAVIEEIRGCQLRLRGGEPPKYHLVVDYRKAVLNGKDRWMMLSKSFLQEAIKRAESIAISLGRPQWKEGFWSKNADVMLPSSYQPEYNRSEILSLDRHKNFQSLVGATVWMNTTCRPEVCQPLNMLNKFAMKARVGHL